MRDWAGMAAVKTRTLFRPSFFAPPVLMILLLDSNILELRLHRLPRVNLKRDDPVTQRKLWILVREIHHQHSIDILLDVVAFGDDDIVVPPIQLKCRLEFLGSAGLPGHHLLSAFP